MNTCNITKTYVGKDESWLGIWAEAIFAIISTTNSLKGYSIVQLLFGCDIIVLIKNMVDWELIHQKKKTKINKDNIRENRNLVDHDYNVQDKVMLDNYATYKYETPYKGPFVITRRFNNGKVKIQYGWTKIRYNIRRIKPYKPDINVEHINPKNVCDNVKIRLPVI